MYIFHICHYLWAIRRKEERTDSCFYNNRHTDNLTMDCMFTMLRVKHQIISLLLMFIAGDGCVLPCWLGKRMQP